MSTRSRIGREYTDGRIQSVYCHSDGYPEWVGKVLLENHDSAEAAEAILALGDLSSINVALDPCSCGGFNWCGEGHFEHTRAYRRDRGDSASETNPVWSSGRQEYLHYANQTDGEYAYLWNGQWFVSTVRRSEPPEHNWRSWRPVAEVLGRTSVQDLTLEVRGRKIRC